MNLGTNLCRGLLGLGLAGGLIASALSASGVIAQRFVHTTEADFEPGEFEGTAVTSLGDLEIAPTTALLAELPAEYTVVYDIVELDGVTYVAAGPEGAVFKVVPGEEIAQPDAEADDDSDESSETPLMSLELVLDAPGEQVFDLAIGDRSLMAAVSGSPSRVVMLTHVDEPQTILELPDVRYIWEMMSPPENPDAALLATGPDGKVLLARSGGAGEEGVVVETLLDTPQANVLRLAAGRDENGKPTYPVFAGTDTDGILYRIDEDGSSRPVYDAAEPEIAAITVATDGTVYFGTADANQAKPGRMDGANEDETGRPDSEVLDGEAPDLTEPADDPDMPELPEDPAPMQSDNAEMSSADADDIVEDAAAADNALAEEATDAEPAEMPDEPADLAPEGELVDDEATAGVDLDVEVTPEQYDALRDEVKRRLDAAAKGGKLAAGGKSSASDPKATRARTPGRPAASAKEGNAVYKLAPDGLVTEPFRETVMILSLHLDETRPGGRLLIATGSEGQLYEVQLATRETAVVTDLDAEQVYRIVHAGDQTILATANPATLRTLDEAGSSGATYTSIALDAEQISLWGKLLVALGNGVAETVSIETRTGAVADPESAAWSPWEPAPPVEADRTSGLVLHEVASPPARFIQYRLALASTDTIKEAVPTPSIDRVELAYVRPNLAPAVTSLTAEYGETPEDPDEPTPTTVNVEWEAEDPNGDRVRFDLQAKPVRFEGGAASPVAWLTVAEDLDESPYEWDTRTLPDGRYVLRVVAHDRLDNPAGSARAGSRRSAPLVVDNTPPAVELEATTAPTADTRGVFVGQASDAISPLLSVDFRVADDQPWRPALPDDLIYDSTSEAFTFTLPRLARGGHVLSLRARDTRGNVTYLSRFLTVE